MSDIELLGRKLESSDAEERREAAIDLGRSGKRAVRFLFRALADSNWRVRKTAVEALVELADEQVIEGLVQALSSHDNAGARNSAIEALVHIGPAAVDRLLASLGTADPDVRKFVVDILGDIRDTRSVPELIERVRDQDENVRVAAAEALGKIKDRRAVDTLLGCLARYDNSWLDYAAAEALGEIGDERALGPLIAALGRSSLREPVLESLGKIGNIETLGPLLAGLADPLRIVREVSVTALLAIYGKSGAEQRDRMVLSVRSAADDRSVGFLEELLTTSSGHLQKAAITVLGWTGRESSFRKLLALLKEEDMEDPTAFALAAADRSHAPLLLGYLHDENPLVRRTVARVLGSIGFGAAEEALCGLASDENGHVRSAAAEALGRLRSRKAVPGLLTLLADEYESVQESAIRALAEIGDESALDGLIKDFTSRDVHMRKNIALLLGKFSSERAVDALAFALKDEEHEVRKAVVHALGNLSGERAYRSLMLAVTDDDPEVRMLAADALGSTGMPQAGDALLSLLRDPDLWVRAAAARGLGKTGCESAGRVLAEQLPGASDIFLLAIIEVLGRLRPAGVLEQLLELTAHEDHEVRKTVLVALSGYRWEAVRPAVVALLGDAHWSVRKAAVETLKQQHDTEAQPILEGMAEQDPDGSVRQAAQEALES